MNAAQSSMIPLSVPWLKEYFRKRTIFAGIPVLELLVPNVLGVKKMKKNTFLRGRQFDHFLLRFCEPTLSNLLSTAQVFSNPAIDGGPQQMVHVKLC